MSVSCAPSKLWNLRQKARICKSRVSRRWCPSDQFVACVNNLAVTPGNLATKIASWCLVACGQAVLTAVHGVSDELQELLKWHWNAADVVERRLISKTIWRVRRKERRKRALEMVASAVESKLAPGPPSLWQFQSPQLVQCLRRPDCGC